MRIGSTPVLFMVALLLAMGGFLISQSGWPGVGRGVTIIFSVLAAILAIAWFAQGALHVITEYRHQSRGRGHDKK